MYLISQPNYKRERKQQGEHGAALMEATVSIFFVLTLLLTTLTISILFVKVLAVRYAVDLAVRRGSFPRIVAPITTIENTVINEARRFRVTVTPADITICPLTNPGCTVDSMPGAEGLFSVRVDLSIPYFSAHAPSLKFMQAYAVGKVEPIQ